MIEYAGSQRAGLRRESGEGVALLSVLRSFDWILLVGVAALVGVGLWGIAGVTKFDIPGDPNYYLDKQIVYVAAGAALMLAFALVDPDLYRRYWRLVFGVAVGLIAVVFLLGRAARGS